MGVKWGERDRAHVFGALCASVTCKEVIFDFASLSSKMHHDFRHPWDVVDVLFLFSALQYINISRQHPALPWWKLTATVKIRDADRTATEQNAAVLLSVLSCTWQVFETKMSNLGKHKWLRSNPEACLLLNLPRTLFHSCSASSKSSCFPH